MEPRCVCKNSLLPCSRYIPETMFFIAFYVGESIHGNYDPNCRITERGQTMKEERLTVYGLGLRAIRVFTRECRYTEPAPSCRNGMHNMPGNRVHRKSSAPGRRTTHLVSRRMSSAVVLILWKEEPSDLRRAVDGIDDQPEGLVHGRKTYPQHDGHVQVRRSGEDAQCNSQPNLHGNGTIEGAQLCKRILHVKATEISELAV